MSRTAAFLRDVEGMRALKNELAQMLREIYQWTCPNGRPAAWLTARDQMRTQLACVDAMLLAAQQGLPCTAMVHPRAAVPDGNHIVQTQLAGDGVVSTMREATPIPESDLWFENVWRQWRERNKQD